MANRINGQRPQPGELASAIANACFRDIRTHIDRYSAADEPDQYLPLADPGHFAQFACQAHHEVAVVVTNQAIAYHRGVVASFGAPPPALKRLEPTTGTISEVESRLAFCWEVFGRTLEQYGGVYARFCQLLGHVNSGTAHLLVAEHGLASGELGRQLFGPLGAAAFGFLGTWFSGNRVQKHCEAETARYNQAFSAMLEAWDQACDALFDAANDLILSYRTALDDAASESDGHDGVSLTFPVCNSDSVPIAKEN